MSQKKIPLEIPSAAHNNTDMNVSLIEKEHINGNITLEELSIICGLIKQHNPKNIFEIGTFDGRTTINMAMNSGGDSKVYTIDLPKEFLGRIKFPLYPGDELVPNEAMYIDKEIIGSRYLGKKHSEKIVQLLGDTATFDFSPYYNKMDFIFVDGSHAKDYVKNDTEVAFKLLGDNSGIILWHDYGVWKDVTNELNDYFRNDTRFSHARRIENTCLVMLENKI